MATAKGSHEEATWESLLGPRTFLGRFIHPMLEQRKTLAGRLTWFGLILLFAFIVVAIFSPFISPYDPTQIVSTQINQAPSAAHWMGTDYLGRDVFSRVLWGARSSLEIMVIGVFLALFIGFPVGLYSGYHGGYLDRVLVLVMDSVYAFPGLLLAALVALFLGKGVVNIGIAITVIYIPLYYRVTRNHVLSIKQETYVEAARALGAKPRTVMWSYIASNVLVSIPVIFSLNAADAILTAAGLSFLGFGLERPIPDWGLDLSDAQRFLGNGVWWTSVFPGLMIILLTVGLSFLGEGLNDLVNPLLKRER
jgi:peptide/nickel transport system permease protein